MKYKPGDRVRVRQWVDMMTEYRINKRYNDIKLPNALFVEKMAKYCGREVTICWLADGKYFIREDGGRWAWTEEMLEREPVCVWRLNRAGRLET